MIDPWKLTLFYVYDADMDHDKEDPGYLGHVEATTLEAAQTQARRIWPSIASLRVSA
jgi:hypothetical protein